MIRKEIQKNMRKGLLLSSMFLTNIFVSSSVMALGVKVTSITTNLVTGSPTSLTINGTGSGAYPNSAFNLNFAAQTESITGGTTSGGFSFSTIGAIPLSFVLNRNTGSGTTASSEIVWSKESSRSGNTRNLLSTQPTTEQAALASNNINLGTDNLFTNTGDGNGNNNNVERLDFINVGGFAASNTLVFSIFERGNTGGHDAFKIAAITAVSGGVASGYGTLVTVNSTDYGDAGSGFASVVQRATSGNLAPSADTGNTQVIGGVAIRTTTDLGITSGTTIYGYSLFGDDVPNSANLINFNSFPTGTTTGGIDLIGANIGAVNLTTPVPFEFNPQFGLGILGGVYLLSKVVNRKSKSR